MSLQLCLQSKMRVYYAFSEPKVHLPTTVPNFPTFLQIHGARSDFTYITFIQIN